MFLFAFDIGRNNELLRSKFMLLRRSIGHSQKENEKAKNFFAAKFVEPNFRIDVLDLSAENVFSVCDACSEK